MIQASIAVVVALALGSCSSKKKSEAIKMDDAAVVATSRAPQVREIEPEVMVLRQVFVEESPEGGALTLPGSEMAKQLGGTLVTSGFLAARDGDVPDSHRARRVEAFLSLSYDWAPQAQANAGALVLAAEARLEFIEGRSDLAPRVAILLDAEVPHSASDPDGSKQAQLALDQLAQAATENLGESLVARERLRRSTHAELLSALSVGLREPTMRIWGLQLAADRGLREAATAAARSLDTEDEALRSAATAALVAFRDPTTVAALIEGVDFNSYEELRVTMEAISAIGGDDAIEFLEFLASGHSDDEIRERAKQSLLRLRESKTQDL
tara:strand:+ start:2976 stop:3953 length:978 start_codon:yes stop_codon:yes gene_type:complete